MAMLTNQADQWSATMPLILKQTFTFWNSAMTVRSMYYLVLMLAFVPRPQESKAQIDSPPAAPVMYQPMVVIGPENSRVEFIGTHVGDSPRPRLGGFKEFRGHVGLNAEGTAIETLNLNFEMDSIWTEFDNLTNHLKNADFFETATYPTARFTSTRVVNLPNGGCNIQGELTLHGQTAAVSIPANYQLDQQGLKLNAQFFMDRTDFGMDKMLDGVEKQVSVQLTVGQPDRKQPQGEAAPAMSVATEDFVVIGPQNSAVEFVGTHVGDDPKPRLGGFQNFRGMVGVDPSSKSIKSLQMQFSIDSIWTEFDRLTSHLLTADFFDAQNYPLATFSSRQVIATGDRSCTISGNLTLHGTTIEIKIPAQYEITDQGLTLKSQFIIDRSEFGMDKMTDGVETPVTIRFNIGTADRKFKEIQTEKEAQQQSRLKQQQLNRQSARLYLPKMLQY